MAVRLEGRAPAEETGEADGGRAALGGGHASVEMKERRPPGSQLMNGRGVPRLIEI